MAICTCQLEDNYKNTKVCKSNSCQYLHTVLVDQITGNLQVYMCNTDTFFHLLSYVFKS